MKTLKIFVGLAAAAVVCLSGTAHAARVGVFIGGGPGYYWGPPAYYYPPPAVVAVPVEPDEPPQYVEQGQPAPAPADAAQQSAGTWYYCDASRTYYPYVKECATNWRAVPAQPPAN